VSVSANFGVAICLTYPGGDPGNPVAAFNYNIIYDDSVFSGTEIANAGTGLEDNPDANDGTGEFSTPGLGANWDCNPVSVGPEVDNNGASGPGNGNTYSGGCSSTGGATLLPSPGPLGVVTYTAGGSAGFSTLVFGPASLTLDSLDPLGECNQAVPTGAPVIPCIGGDVTVLGLPTNTPTNTPTDTPTATNTPTATATSADPEVFKVPANDNLFLCTDTDGVGPICSGYNEGKLVIEERANIPEPIGAWEIQIKFDHKVFNVSIDPNEALFTAAGRTPNCSMSVVTENWVLFGCVSTDDPGGLPADQSGPSGPNQLLATITLTPNEDLKFRLHPGNDNGVVRMILDENCELADPLGHPVINSVNGGLAKKCDDASVTVRILEGDLNLDCEVDGVDAQMIAGRYGTFFGNIYYDPWFDLEPALKDFDIDIKDLQKVFGRDGSTCAMPIPPQPPGQGYSVGPL
jgi:hypothetical protein